MKVTLLMLANLKEVVAVLGKERRGRKVGGCGGIPFVEYIVQQVHHCTLDSLDVWTGTRLVWIGYIFEWLIRR